MNLPETLPLWLYLVIAAGGLGGVGAIVSAIVSARKTPSEIHVTDESAHKIAAETKKIGADTAAQIGAVYRALIDQQQKAFDDRLHAQDELIEAQNIKIKALVAQGEHLEALLKERETERVRERRERESERRKYDKHVKNLEDYVVELRKVMVEAGLPVPPLPDWWRK